MKARNQPESWLDLPFWKSPVWKEIKERLEKTPNFLPGKENLFRSLRLSPLHKTKVVIIGQDPYHTPGAADGLAFSYGFGKGKYPPSLVNIFKELVSDLGCPYPGTGDLSQWARQGVLLINSIATVEAKESLAHAKWGWQNLTRDIVRLVSEYEPNVVFILWGEHAQGFKQYVRDPQGWFIESAHPSPLSASRGFFGSRPFSRCNKFLEVSGLDPINWELQQWLTTP